MCVVPPDRAARPRVLVLAEECNPDMVSIPLEGWSHYAALARVADVHLVTQVRNRPAILRAGLVEGRDFTAIDTEPLAKPLFLLRPFLGAGGGKGWTVVTALQTLQYPYFEALTWRHFGRRIAAGDFDLVHRLVPLSPTAPSLLAARCRGHGVPFVLGPLNGGLPWPKAFDRERRRENEWLSYLRGVYKLLPGYHDTWRNASAAIIGSADTWRQIPRQHLPKCVYVPENGIDPARFVLRRPCRPTTRPIRVVFVGRLVPYKGADMLIDAATDLVRRGDVTLDIVGDGPMMSELRGVVEGRGLGGEGGGGVQLGGWVDHREVQGRLARADVLGFPSIREFGGGVVLEAMAVGTPPIVVNYGGPAELVTDQTGFLLPMGSRAEIVSALRRQLESLVADPSQIEARSAPAIRRVHELFTWPAKARQTLEVYRWVLGLRNKPNTPMPLPDLTPLPEPAVA